MRKLLTRLPFADIEPVVLKHRGRPIEPPIPIVIYRLAEAIKAAGGYALLIGGAPRDIAYHMYVQQQPLPEGAVKDWDIEVFGLGTSDLLAVLEPFGVTESVGEAFGVFKIGSEIDVSLPRSENKVGRGHRDFTIDCAPGMDLMEASRRRDLSINSFAFDPLTGLFYDPQNGLADLQNGVLNVVDKHTFVEDPLRVLRAAQLAARFCFRVAPDLFLACRSIQEDLKFLPKERLWVEMEKILLRGRRPSYGIVELGNLGATEVLFPEIAALEDVEQDPTFHPEGDVYIHTLLVINEARKMLDGLSRGEQVVLMLSALCHDFGKPATTQFIEGRWRAKGHEEAGVEPTLSFLERLNVNKVDGFNAREMIPALVGSHLRLAEFARLGDAVRDGAYNRLALQVNLDLLMKLTRADLLGRGTEDRFERAASLSYCEERIERLGVRQQAPTRILLGRHLINELGLTPGSHFGGILDHVFNLQIEGEVRSLDEALAAARNFTVTA